MSKPLKTVEDTLDIIIPRVGEVQGMTEEIRKLTIETAKQELDAHYYQLILSLLPKEREWDRNEPYDNPDVAQGHNEAVSDMKEKLSEHFNGEGEI